MRAILCFLFVFLHLICVAQIGYRFDFTVHGLKDTTAYLGYFLKDNTFVEDTAKVDSKGSFTFDGLTALPQGVYFLVINRSRLLDFVVGEDQHFSIVTRADNYAGSVKVTGDVDNTLFFQNIKAIEVYNKEAESHVRVLRDSTATEKERQTARSVLQKINEKALAAQDAIISDHPSTVTARLLKINKPIAVPDPPKNNNGKVDSSFFVRYYREHYFDNFDLGDELMLRTPKVFYWEKVHDYLTRLFVPHPDSITRAINVLAEKARANPETYRYLLWKCIGEYQYPEVMGLDEVYVNLVDQYFSSGEMDDWLDKKTLSNIKEIADDIRKSMIGRKAPNLIMQDLNHQPKELYSLQSKYTIIFYFWTQCGHCRAETPKLVDLYHTQKSKFDFEVYAIATDTSMQDIREFVGKFKTPWTTVCGPRTYTGRTFTTDYYAPNTPTIYILDENKKVIARRLGIDQIVDFLTNYERLLHRRETDSGSTEG